MDRCNEIGSEFWEVPTCEKENKIFPRYTKWFLAGRTALKYIIEDADIQEISMPRWCCDSMISPFIEAGAKVLFYDDKPSNASPCIFVMDYFGYQGSTVIPKDYQGIIIRDLTHSIFSRTYDDADYYFGSLRKWAGFCTGGFAWGKWKKNSTIPKSDERYVSLRMQAMDEKKEYIDGKTNQKSFLGIFKEADDYLETLGISSATEEDIVAARHFDIEFVKTKRRENAKILIEHVSPIYQLKENDCPLFVPISTDNRDALHRYLVENEIYCPIHWPENDLDGTELSIVCDQRYDVKDMQRICEVIDAFNI